MISSQARNFAKFAMRSTPKNAMRALSSRPSAKGFQFGVHTSVPGLSSQLAPFPPTLSNTGTGVALPSTLLSRLLTTSTSGKNPVDTVCEETTSPTAEPRVHLGSIIEANEDLDAILSKIMIESSRSQMETFTVLVDFYASWCMPCKTLSPLLSKIVAEQKKAILIKVDVDEAPTMAEKYGVTSLPTVKIFRDGKMLDGFVGSRSKAFIEDFLSKY